MFRENKRYQQVSLFGTLYQLPTGVKKILDKSWAPAFRKLIFEKIDEKRYAGLYSEVASRPNFPVNVWVGLVSSPLHPHSLLQSKAPPRI